MHRTDLRVFTEPQQGADYEDLLAVAQRAESLGFGAFFRSDHYLAMDVAGLPGPSDAWITLAALARETDTIRLGTLVTSATFRYPGPLAIAVAGVDRMSGGRVELGIGAGWYAAEHAAYAIPFPPTGERFDRLEETLAVVTGLWRTPAGSSFDYDGRFYRVADSPGLPKPVQPGGPPILIGGKGARRTPALAARYAAEFNVPFEPAEFSHTQFGRVREACSRAGRDPGELVYSNALVTCVGSDEAQYRRRAKAIGRDADELRRTGLAGTLEQARERLAQYAEAGCERVYLQVLDLSDLDHLDLLAQLAD